VSLSEFYGIYFKTPPFMVLDLKKKTFELLTHSSRIRKQQLSSVELITLLCVAMSFAMPAVGENFNAWFSN
jgi:hypothetical protein